jgi:flagellar basal body rod protein FlgG
MDSLIATAASGMRSRTETLDLLANNIANSGTAGYKADEESYNLYFSNNAWEGYDEGRPPGAEMPVVQRNWTDYSQGSLVPTGSSTDLALESSGFFVVDTASGPLYTRNGHFTIAKSGQLETREGYSVSGSDGKPILLDPNQDVTITPAGELQQNGAVVAQLAIVDGAKLDAIEKRGAGYFRFSPATKLQAVANPRVAQGKLEMSNVTPAYSAVKLVNVMRSFEMLQRAVTMSSNMDRQVIEQVAKVTS